MGESPSIQASGLTKRFGEVTAVSDVSLDIHPGEIYGFLGLNGAGKTTTIRMLLGMIRPDAGSVSLFGTRVRASEPSIWRRVGYLVETPHAYPDLTVRENLDVVRRLRMLKDANTVDKIMAQLELTPYSRRRAGTLSLGNAQRLGLAKALIHRPDILILDEPANGLDPAGIVQIRNLLRGLAERQGVTVFISSHILGEIARLATRIGVIHEGRLMKEINSSELDEQGQQHLTVNARDVASARTALQNAGFTAIQEKGNSLLVTDRMAVEHPDRVATLLVQAGTPPTRLVVEQTDLEAYFLRLVGTKGAGNE
jgi:ABC-2 type transport system ATP-binding protein